MKLLSVGDHSTSVRDEGSGQPCVLLHGSPLDQHSWDMLVPLLSHDRRVVCYDLRGHGSAATAPIADSVDVFARDLEVLLDSLEVAQAHVVGHSFGGQVAQRFAVRCPSRVHRLTLLCTRATPYPAFDEAARELERTGHLEPSTVIARWFPADAITAEQPWVRYAKRCLTEIDPAVWASVLHMIAAFDHLEELHSLTMPTLLIGAQNDRVATVEAMTCMVQALPQARLRLLRASYHLAPLLEPARVVAMIRENDNETAD
ncbi:alpha/beta fold hydrolase [Streptomyces sp. NPDC055254]